MKRTAAICSFFAVPALLVFAFATSESSAADAPAKVELRFWNAEHDSVQIATTKKIIAAFEKSNPAIGVRFIQGADVEGVTLADQLSGDSVPDVFVWWGSIADLQQRLLPLGSYVKAHKLDLGQYWKCLVDYYSSNGELLVLPLQLKVPFVAYNKVMFKRAGLADPKENWTWDDYLETAKKLTQDVNHDGKNDQWGTDNQPVAPIFMAVNGGGILDSSGTRCILDSKQNADAIDYLYKLYKNYGTPLAEAPKVGKDAMTRFAEGKVGMLVLTGWEIPSYNAIKGLAWDVAPLPQPAKKTPVYMFSDAGIAIAKKSKHPDEAFQFAVFYTGEEGMKIFAAGKNGIPANRKAAQSVFVTPPPAHLKYLLAAAEKATIPEVPKIADYNKIMKGFWPEWDSLTESENKNAAQAVKDGQSIIDRILKARANGVQ